MEKVGETDATQKLTCKTAPTANNGDGSFACTALGHNKPYFKIVTASTAEGVSVVITLSGDFDATTSFRCNVEVGEGDEIASDTKLIHVQKIS